MAKFEPCDSAGQTRYIGPCITPLARSCFPDRGLLGSAVNSAVDPSGGRIFFGFPNEIRAFSVCGMASHLWKATQRQTFLDEPPR